jgi:hypothetical protein
MAVVHLIRIAPYQGAALRRGRREQLESNHRKKWATARKARPIADVTSIALGKEETAVCLQAIRFEYP